MRRVLLAVLSAVVLSLPGVTPTWPAAAQEGVRRIDGGRGDGGGSGVELRRQLRGEQTRVEDADRRRRLDGRRRGVSNCGR